MSSPTLVGREQALGRLLEAVAGARAGEPRHVVVGGEAGVGKTRLLSRARELVEGDGGRVVSGGRIDIGDAALPFAPYVEIVRTLIADEGAVQIAALAGRGAGDLEKLVPALSPDEAPPAQERWAQSRLYEALLALF